MPRRRGDGPEHARARCRAQEAAVRGLVADAVTEAHKAHAAAQHDLAGSARERMWRVLQAVLSREEHMLATNRKCGRCGQILVLDTDFGGAAHAIPRWVMKEGVSLEVMHVRRRKISGSTREQGCISLSFIDTKGSWNGVCASG